MKGLEKFYEANGFSDEEKEIASAILTELNGLSIAEAQGMLDLCKGAVMLTTVNCHLETLARST